MTSDTTTTQRPVRRRASRAAGPTADSAAAVTAVPLEGSARPGSISAKPLGPPPRRRANLRRVAIIGLLAVVLLAAVAGGAAAWLGVQHKDVAAVQDRDQRFIDTAKQTVINMFSFTQDTIDQSVNRFVGDTSGPLRDMLSHNNNADNLKAMFRDTNASSEAVINGAALEGVDNVSNNASVLVAVRVTVTDMQGVNKPSQPYRMRVIVHEDDSGRMTGYDLKYPDGGN
ncbi:mammalian cell entry protein [Mycolicibacterium sp. P1-5]|uniref:mammalian cell entry protein n=1 Tax=Mycolicibacterium sp. P1-5 TaxID=2024617 RepID=UPI0011EC7AC5|nr:mammalian cell entry protein [Mycolicibacterium sp. P1-5]KAA0109306.1 mammalian cell entry protein [Mycolicibacterium sp. P1-5]